MKRLRMTFIAALAADLALILASWSRLPARVPMHWNFHGQVDRYGSRLELVWFGPLILAFLWGLSEVIRFADPKLARARDPDATESERLGALALVMGIVAALMVGIHATIFLQALGILAEARRAHAVLLAAFCVVFGNFIGRVRPNFFVGIRTPWTLSSDEVWRRTHRIAARIMVPAGLLAAVGALVLPAGVAFPAAIVLLLGALLVPAVLSYVFWRQRAV